MENAVALIVAAVDFASVKHQYQKRKNVEESAYFVHLSGVVRQLSDAGIEDPNILAAAYLHDTVEDTNTTEKELVDRFGSEITSMVMDVTDDKSLPKAKRKGLQVDNAPSKPHGAKLIILSDKLHNLRDLHRELPRGWTEERRVEYFKWSEDVVRGCRGTNIMLEKWLDTEFEEAKKYSKT
jgi:guanosine-3',5'-bis(diphosphate) 3'-pyrophosphohydrolase